MASNGTIAHRFANKDYNMERGLKGNSTHIVGNNYYSYSTVFGQWVDEKLCIVYWGDTSITSNKHKLYPSSFPKDVVVLPYDDGGRNSYSYHGCDLLGWRGKFDFDKRVELIDYYVNKIYDALAAINGGTKKNLEDHARRTIESYWGYVMKLCALYRDTTINKWLRVKRIDLNGEWKRKKKLVKELDAQNMDVQSLVDIVFGEGKWKAYYDYCARYRKAEDKRAKVEVLCNRLGIASPYDKYCGRSVLGHEMSADEIRKLTAKERLDIHFKSIAYKEYKEHENERNEKYNNNFRNAYKWIVGSEPKQKYCGGGYEKDVHDHCINKDTGVVYECSGEYIYGFYWCDTRVSFDYDEFRKSENKEQWISDFYARCKKVADNRKAISILRWAKANTREKKHSWDDDVYVLDEKLTGIGMDDESLAIVSDFIRRQDKHYADEEARRRAAEIARMQREEEERKEKEYLKQVKQEQIVECLKDGSEGCRNLWRKHLLDLYDAKASFNDASVVDKDGDFFMGGNVLLRLNLNKDKVETSKSIRIPVEVCKKMWKIVSKWHENPSCFKPMQIDTKVSGKYTISSYEDDILTAGCHDIAYAEMEHMYNEIVKLENEAA